MDSSSEPVATLLASIDATLAQLPEIAASEERGFQRTQLARLRLEADRLEAQLHDHIAMQPVTYGEAAFCTECGEPAPCPALRGLMERYAEGS